MRAFIEKLEAEIKTIEAEMKSEAKKPKDDDNLYWFFCTMHSNYCAIYRMARDCERQDFKKQLEEKKYTPFISAKTQEPILLGDVVEVQDTEKRGVLEWNEKYNQYMIVNENNHLQLSFGEKLIKEEY